MKKDSDGLVFQVSLAIYTPIDSMSYSLSSIGKSRCGSKEFTHQHEKETLAGGGFDPPTFGLWAQHASSAPTRCA
jgi:hypothetical protein